MSDEQVITLAPQKYEYTFEDFMSTEPYDRLYDFFGSPFVFQAEVEKVAKIVGIGISVGCALVNGKHTGFAAFWLVARLNTFCFDLEIRHFILTFAQILLKQ